MNIANRVTVVRLFIPVLFIPALLTGVPYGGVAALILFLIGTASDWLDGYLARRLHLESDFGRLMDPLADKILVASALICFVAMPDHIVKAWMVVIIIGRDFLITGMRSLALRHNTVIAANTIGKHKTAWQMTGIIMMLFYYAYLDARSFVPARAAAAVDGIAPPALTVLFYGIVILTFLSGIVYAAKYRDLLLKNA